MSALPRSTARLAAALLGLLALAGCALFTPPGGSGPRTPAERHPDARFLVDYGGEPFRADIRFVDIIGESVIAVRRGAPSGGTAGWTALSVTPSLTLPRSPFADPAWRGVAVDIADALTGAPPVCANGQTMRLRLKDDETARTLYRAKRMAWVVFAFCPAAAT